MRKLIKLEKDKNMVFSSSLGEYLNPDYIYLPIKDNYKLLVKNQEYIYKGQTVMENNLNKIISPISGNVIGLMNRNYDKTSGKCLVIQNDYKEKEKYTSKKKVKYTKDTLISKLYDYYFKYIASTLENKKINNLIISGIDDEPYVLNNSYILNHYSKEILEIVNILSTTFNIPNSVIVIKSIETKTIEKYLNIIGTYPNISIRFVEDKYLLGNSFFLTEYLEYNDIDTFVIDSKMALNIYNAIKYNRHICENFITISGNPFHKSYVLKVKIGTLLSDAINEKMKLKNKNCDFILDGLMTGQKCDINSTIVTNNTCGVIAITPISYHEEKCISCGLCYKYCPVKVNPKKVMDSKKISNNCIDCGICTYLCPCHINLRKFLRGEHE